MANHTAVMEFFLMEFSDTGELQVLLAFLFLLIYAVTLMGNLVIIVFVTTDQCLHTRLYFFLKNLSLLDVSLVSVTVQKFVLNSLSHRSTISFPACVLQVFLVIHFAAAELFLLMSMSCDRYVAISHPLHYAVIMNRGDCVQVVAVSWFLGNILGVLYSAGTFTLSFCGSRKLSRFFCDVPSLLKISCSNSHITVDVSVAIAVIYALFCFMSIGFSYIYIFNTVLKMPYVQGRSKSFSTCVSRLIVVITFMTATIVYLEPVPDSPHLVDFLVSAFNSLLPLSLNPIVYSLRNKEIKASLWKIFLKQSQYRFYVEKQ